MNRIDHFERGPGKYKYTAVLKNGKRVNFGHVDYEQYCDSVPKNMGGGLWSHCDHGDKVRRSHYRSRHEGVLTKDGTPAYKVILSPSWLSYRFLW
jgi:hypothetical protein